MSSVLRDIRQASRSLSRSPGFTAAAILTLALGIGATTAVFSVFYGVTQRALPYPNGERVVRVIQVIPPRGDRTTTIRAGISADQLRDWKSSTLAGIAIVSVDSATLTGVHQPVRLNGARVSPAMFSILGVKALIGRTFVEAEGQRGAAATVILGHQTWVEHFGSDESILNRVIKLNERPHQVVGVMPEAFGYPERGPAGTRGNSTGRLEGGPDYWVPFQVAPSAPLQGHGFTLAPAIALVRERIPFDQAIAEANSTIPDLPGGQRHRVELVNIRDEAAREIKPVLTAFQLGVFFVLLIACVNVTNLLLARAARRRRELAVRVALGARSVQIAGEIVAESTLLAFAAAALGWFIADVGIRGLVSLPAGTIPRLHDVRLDYFVFIFTLSVTLLVGLLIGFVVACRTLHANPWLWLRQRSRGDPGAMSAFGRVRPSSALIVASITAAVVLLTAAGLLLNSLVRLVNIDVGFDRDNLLTFEIALPTLAYSDPNRQKQLLEELDASLRNLPGIEGAAVSSSTPFQLRSIGSPLNVPGEPEANGEAAYRTVGPGYFRTLRMPILAGREFGPGDREGQPLVVVVNEALARQYFGRRDVVGRAVQFLNRRVLTIVGVVGNAKTSRLDNETMAEIYFPNAQPPKSSGFLTVAGLIRTRTASEHVMPGVQAAVKALDPSLAVFNVAWMEQIVSETFALSRLYTTTAASFATVALLLATIGLYGLLAYDVSNQTHEIGIRIALGADSKKLIRDVLRHGLLLTFLGLLVGLAGALGTTKFLENLLFGIEPQDPATLGSVAVLFMFAAFFASYLPARRATCVDPIMALRTE